MAGFGCCFLIPGTATERGADASDGYRDRFDLGKSFLHREDLVHRDMPAACVYRGEKQVPEPRGSHFHVLEHISKERGKVETLELLPHATWLT